MKPQCPQCGRTENMGTDQSIAYLRKIETAAAELVRVHDSEYLRWNDYTEATDFGDAIDDLRKALGMERPDFEHD